jgi:hypothetical protein
MENDKNGVKLRCSECRKSIDYGRDAISTEACVNGPRGLVSLGEKLVFCSEECVSNFFRDSDLSDLPSLPPRIP